MFFSGSPVNTVKIHCIVVKTYGYLLERVWGRSSEPRLSRDGGDPAAVTVTSQRPPPHGKGWRKFPATCGPGLAAASQRFNWMSSLSTVLWTKYLKVTAHGADPVKCGADVQAKEVSRVCVYVNQVTRAVSLLRWGFSLARQHDSACSCWDSKFA